MVGVDGVFVFVIPVQGGAFLQHRQVGLFFFLALRARIFLFFPVSKKKSDLWQVESFLRMGGFRLVHLAFGNKFFKNNVKKRKFEIRIYQQNDLLQFLNSMNPLC